MIREFFDILFYVLFQWTPKLIKNTFIRIFVCSYKKHDYVWSGGWGLFNDKNNMHCKRCHKGIHKTLQELEADRENNIPIKLG